MIDAAATYDLLESCLATPPDRDAVTAVRDWFAIRSHPGLVRKENQDRVAAARWTAGAEVRWALAVADGIGSGKAGGAAACTAVAAFLSAIIGSGGSNPSRELAVAGEHANDAIHRRWRGREGATLSVLLQTGNGAWLLNVGDSRIYGIKTNEVSLLTRDDVLAALPGQLLQFIGMGKDMTAHVMPIPPGYTQILITSDGVHGYVEPLLPQLVKTAAGDARLLVDRLTRVSLWCGGADNITCGVATLGVVMSPAGADLDVWTPGIHHRMPALRGKASRPRRRPAADPLTVDRDNRAIEHGDQAEHRAPPLRPGVTMAFDDDPHGEVRDNSPADDVEQYGVDPSTSPPTESQGRDAQPSSPPQSIDDSPEKP